MVPGVSRVGAQFAPSMVVCLHPSRSKPPSRWGSFPVHACLHWPCSTPGEGTLQFFFNPGWYGRGRERCGGARAWRCLGWPEGRLGVSPVIWPYRAPVITGVDARPFHVILATEAGHTVYNAEWHILGFWGGVLPRSDYELPRDHDALSLPRQATKVGIRHPASSAPSEDHVTGANLSTIQPTSTKEPDARLKIVLKTVPIGHPRPLKLLHIFSQDPLTLPNVLLNTPYSCVL